MKAAIRLAINFAINVIVSWGTGALYLLIVYSLGFRHSGYIADHYAHSLSARMPLAERIFYDSAGWFALLIPIAMVIFMSSQLKAWVWAGDHEGAKVGPVRTRSHIIPGANLMNSIIIFPGILLAGTLGGFQQSTIYLSLGLSTILGLFGLAFALSNERRVVGKHVRAIVSAQSATYLIVSAIVWVGLVEPWGYSQLVERSSTWHAGTYYWDRGDTMLMALGSALVLLIAFYPVYGRIISWLIRKLGGVPKESSPNTGC